MKKILLGSAAILLATTLFAQAEQHPGGPPKPPPIAERWKYDSTKLQLYVVLNGGQTSNVKSAFLSFYNDMDALMQQGRNNRPAPPAREEIEKIRTKRNTALKTIFTPQQFDRFQTFEREFMPPPPRPRKASKPDDAVEKVEHLTLLFPLHMEREAFAQPSLCGDATSNSVSHICKACAVGDLLQMEKVGMRFSTAGKYFQLRLT